MKISTLFYRKSDKTLALSLRLSLLLGNKEQNKNATFFAQIVQLVKSLETTAPNSTKSAPDAAIHILFSHVII